jgi:hypothetical protein
VLLKPSESKKTEKSHNNDHYLLLLCFVASALVGYFLIHYLAPFGV